MSEELCWFGDIIIDLYGEAPLSVALSARLVAILNDVWVPSPDGDMWRPSTLAYLRHGALNRRIAARRDAGDFD